MVPGFHWLTRTEAEEELADFFYTIWYKKKKNTEEKQRWSETGTFW